MVQVQNPQTAVILPAVDRVLHMSAVEVLVAQYGHRAVVHVVRSLLSEIRRVTREGPVLSAEAARELRLAQRRLDANGRRV